MIRLVLGSESVLGDAPLDRPVGGGFPRKRIFPETLAESMGNGSVRANAAGPAADFAFNASRPDCVLPARARPADARRHFANSQRGETMNRMAPASAAIAALILTATTAPAAAPNPAVADRVALPPRRDDYAAVVRRTAAMTQDDEARRLAAARGLHIVNVTWEDTGRFKGSAVGPNISDMTIQVRHTDPGDGRTRLTCMPVIRFPNFSDKTGDIPPERFFVLTGNEKGRPLMPVSLRDLLGNLRRHLAVPRSWKGFGTSLLADRDTHVLVSAQACFLPVPKQGIAEFTPVLFNYQSQPGDPAVLTILATREGTSITVIDNQRDRFTDGGAWGRQLYFNKKGERAAFTGQRLSDFKAAGGNTASPTPHAAGEQGLNMVLLIQVPLKQKARPTPASAGLVCCAAVPSEAPPAARAAGSDVEAAVIGHGKVEGPFTELADLAIERDPAYPVRVTVQFYKATSNGVVSPADVQEIAAQIDRVYKQADYVGSLVTEGETDRPTEHDGPKVQPPGWWRDFWARHQAEFGRDREAVCAALRDVHGPDWFPMTENALAVEACTLPRATAPAFAVFINGTPLPWWAIAVPPLLLVAVGLLVAARRRRPLPAPVGRHALPAPPTGKGTTEE
jgi:hypothetical protein